MGYTGRPRRGHSRPDFELALITGLGATLKHLWVPVTSRVVLSGIQITTLDDMKGSAPMTISAGAPPVLITNTGNNPNGRPYVACTSSNAMLLASGVNIASGNRTAMYVVTQLPGTAEDRLAFTTRQGDSAFDSALSVLGQSATGKYRGYAGFTSGAQDIGTTAAANNSWHLMSIRPLATGASFQIDGVEASPTYTGNSTLQAIQSAQIGHNSLALGLNVAMAALVNNPSTLEHATIHAYVRSCFGLTIAA